MRTNKHSQSACALIAWLLLFMAMSPADAAMLLPTGGEVSGSESSFGIPAEYASFGETITRLIPVDLGGTTQYFELPEGEINGAYTPESFSIEAAVHTVGGMPLTAYSIFGPYDGHDWLRPDRSRGGAIFISAGRFTQLEYGARCLDNAPER